MKKQLNKTILVRPIGNFDDFSKETFSASPWKWGYNGFFIGEKDPDSLQRIYELADTIESICTAFVYGENPDERYPVVERIEETGLMKFMFFNAIACEEHESDVHVLYKTKNGVIKYEEYLKFQKGAIS